MPDQPTIHDHLAELRAAGAEAGDRDALEELAGRVERHVDPEQDDDEGIVDELTKRAVEFETDHPTVADALRRVADALGGIGI